MHSPITLALTHYNRYGMLLEAIAQVKDDPRIEEIVISDDCSTDNSWGDLQFHFAHNPKVKLFRNPTNLDCYFNKKIAVQRSSNRWVILLDSDNILTFDYVNALHHLEFWSSDCIYCPEFAEPHFNYTAFAGMVITRHNVAKLMDRPNFQCLLNTANYFIPKKEWLSVWDGTVDPHTSDSIYQAFNWLRTGHRMTVVPGLHYTHRIHDKSHYKLNVHKTGNFAKEIEEKLRKMQ